MFSFTMACFLLEKGSKSGVCSYYLINRVKLQVVYSYMVTGNRAIKNGFHRGGGVGVGTILSEGKEKAKEIIDDVSARIEGWIVIIGASDLRLLSLCSLRQ
jgi:hypothetical protein